MFVFILEGIPGLLLKVQMLLSSCYVYAFSACQKSRGINNCNEILVFCNTSELRSNKQVSQAPCEILNQRGFDSWFFSSRVTITLMPEHKCNGECITNIHLVIGQDRGESLYF